MAFQFIQGCQYGYKQFEENWDWDARGVLDKTLLVNTIFNFASIFTPTKQLLYAQHNCYFVMSVYDDVYGYVHVVPNYFNVGTVLVDKIYSTELWNANLTKQETLVSLGQTNTDGILFEGPLTYPYTFKPMEAQNYRIKVTMVGPPTINAIYSLNFDEYSVPIRIEGKRLVVFYWMPKNDFTETLEWLTDLIETYSDEQRIALRIAPRRNITYKYVEKPEYASEMQIIANAWISRMFGVPIWVEATKIAHVNSGVTTIGFDTTNASYSNAAFIWENDGKHEAMNITALRSNGIDIDQPLKHEYNNALIMPLLYGFTPSGIDLRQHYGYVEASATFTVVDEVYIGANPFSTYDGYPIIDKNVMVQDINQRIYKNLEFIDNGQGLVVMEPNRGLTEKTSVLGKITNTKADLWTWRKFLHYLCGRQQVFLLPTFQKDIKLIDVIWNGTSIAKIKGLGLNRYSTFPLRTQLVLSNGNSYLIKITGANPIPDSEDETVTIDTSFAFDIKPEDVVRWSFIDLVRLDTDSITLEYDGLVMKCAVPVKVVSA